MTVAMESSSKDVDGEGATSKSAATPLMASPGVSSVDGSQPMDVNMDSAFGLLDEWLASWRTFPLCTKLCAWFGVAQFVLSVFVLGVFGISDSYTVTDPSALYHITNARNMLLPAFVVEAARALTSFGSVIRLKGYPVSVGVMTEYMIKISMYSLMSCFDGGLVSVNARAFGATRPVYTLRFLEWSMTVPIILVLNNLPFIGTVPGIVFARRIAPSLLATSGYVIASWVALVTPSAVGGWILIVVVFAAFGATVVDQMMMVEGLRDTTTDFKFKLFVVVTKDVIFSIYGVIYMLGIVNGLTPRQEQLFYTYGDVMLKVAQVSSLVILRNWQDLVIVQKKIQGQISRSKEDTARLIRKANALMLSMDCDGVITGWNEHLASCSKISEAVAKGKYLQDLVASECRMAVLNGLQQCRNGLCADGLELSLPFGSGGEDGIQHVPILASFIMQLGPDASSIIVVAQDLTDHVAQKALEERQSRFESIVAHELRSPLHGILGLSSAMAETTADKMQKKQLSMIQGCADRLLDLVNNMMENSSQFKRGMQKHKGELPALPQHPVNMLQIIREVTTMTKAAVDKAGKPLLKPSVKLMSGIRNKSLPVVHGDSAKLTQMLYNLTTNACKFTAKGWITIDATHDSEHGFIELSVTDTGTGIASKSLKRIFEPFEQEDAKDSRNFQGVGLGLSVAQGIAKLHGGDVQAKSKLGEGTTFTARIKCGSMPEMAHPTPMDEDASTDKGRGTDGLESNEQQLEQHMEDLRARLDEVRASKERMWEESGHKPLILCVDNDSINQQVVAQNLASCARVHQCQTGAEAIRYLESELERPKIVMVDLMSQHASALEIVLEIRQRLKFPHLVMPIIAFGSKSSREELILQAFWAGATDILLKPFSGNTLRMRVNLALELQREGSEGALAPGNVNSLPVAPTPVVTPGTLRNGRDRLSHSCDQSVVGVAPSLATEAACMVQTVNTMEDFDFPDRDYPDRLRVEGAGVVNTINTINSIEEFDNVERRLKDEAQALAMCRSELEEAASASASVEMRLTEETLACAVATAREETLQRTRSELEAALNESAADLRDLRTELCAAMSAAAAPVAASSGDLAELTELLSAAPPSPKRAVAAAEDRNLNSSWGDNDSVQSVAVMNKEERPFLPVAQEERPFLPVDRPANGGKNVVDFLRVELDGCYRSIEFLRKSLCTEESEAYLQKTRAESKDREVNHLRTQLRRMRRRNCTGGPGSDDRAIGS